MVEEDSTISRILPVIALLGIPLTFVGMLVAYYFLGQQLREGPPTYEGYIANIDYYTDEGKWFTTIQLEDGTVFNVREKQTELEVGKCYSFWVARDVLAKYEECPEEEA